MGSMQLLTWVAGSFPAHVLAARLSSEGIDVQLRGAVDGPYALTVGDLARVDLWVPDDQLEDARLVLLATEVDEVLAAPSAWASPVDGPTRHWPRRAAWLVLGLAGVALPLLGTWDGA